MAEKNLLFNEKIYFAKMFIVISLFFSILSSIVLSKFFKMQFEKMNTKASESVALKKSF